MYKSDKSILKTESKLKKFSTEIQKYFTTHFTCSTL